jgi:hypothetical protein
MKIRISFLIAFSVAPFALLAGAQTASQFAGAITTISGSTLTVKTEAGDAHPVVVPSSTILLRIAPGEKNLSAATPIVFSDLAIGDRVLVKLDPNTALTTAQALRIVVIKQTDIAVKQQRERDEWQRQGAGGLVKSVDAASGVIVLTTGSGATLKSVTIHTASSTLLKRYAADSVRYEEAAQAPIDAIHAGDQLRARGTRNQDGSEMTADEIVSGSFRNISGVIASTDSAGSTLVVKDLATKKPVTIHVTAETQLRRLPDRMAQMLVARLKEATGGEGGQSSRGSNGGDPQQLLNRTPAIQIGDLQKGEAVMLVSSEGANEVTAITLLAGVEPLLESPEASRNLLSSWSLEGGTGTSETSQ